MAGGPQITLKQNTRLFGEHGRGVARRVGRVVRETAERVVERAQDAMDAGPHTGRLYPRPGGYEHQASAPGEPPAVVTSALHASGHVEPWGNRRVDAVFDAPHAVPLEFGTVHMAARPFLGPAVVAEADQFAEDLAKAVKGE